VWAFLGGGGADGGVVVAVLVAALRRAQGPAEADPDLVIYKDQLAEIARDLSRGTIGPEDAERLRAEVARRVLEADRSAGEVQGDGGWPGCRAGGGAGGGGDDPGGGGGLLVAGRAGLSRHAAWPRIAALDAGIAARPSQAGTGADGPCTRRGDCDAAGGGAGGHGQPDDLRGEVPRPSSAGEMTNAVLTQGAAACASGRCGNRAGPCQPGAGAGPEAESYVSPEAETALRAALQRDLTNELARYLVGEMFLQGGRFDQAFRFWRPLLEDSNPAAPWVPAIRERIGMVADLAGYSYEVPAGSGPSAGDVAAAAEMSPEDRQAMIEGMVAQLSDRLASEGGDVEDWDRLIRSLAVLERLPGSADDL
jgi:cytochrome c-type biogenesis protein CcmH